VECRRIQKRGMRLRKKILLHVQVAVVRN
jgi:hypothetical protein